MFFDASATVSVILRLRVPAVLALKIHERMIRLDEGGKDSNFFSARLFLSKSAWRSSGITEFSMCSVAFQVPVRFASWIIASPAGATFPSLMSLFARSRFSVLQLLFGFRRAKCWR
jgi:hypothetical protein